MPRGPRWVAGKVLGFGIGISYLKDELKGLENTLKGSLPKGYVHNPASKYKCPGGGMVDALA